MSEVTFGVRAAIEKSGPSYEGDTAHIKIMTFWSISGPGLSITLDREQGMGWTVPLNRMDLAQRLKMAIDAGVVFKNPVIRTDIEGHTFVSAEARVMGRHMNADLLRLGY